MNDTWISTDEAAQYLGLGMTKLYELTREGRIPAKRVGKKWVYDRQELADWLRGCRPLEEFFQAASTNIETNTDLRDPQRDAYLQAVKFFQEGGKKALIQLPVGCGKTGLAAILPFGI